MTRLGFIGLGDIGLPMARRVLQQRGALVAWNRSRDKLDAFAAEGTEIADSPAEVMRRSDIVGLCLTADQAVEQVAFGPGGLAEGEPAGKLVVDFSTGDPAKAASFAERAAAAGFRWVDSPVSGGIAGAETGTLVLFAGGDAADVAAAEPLTSALAARVTHMGPAGAGQTTKLCNQMMVACNIMLMAEMLAAARRAGVDVGQLPAALAGGFADSKPLQVFGTRMATRQFTPRIGGLALMEKDLGLARKMAEMAGAQTPISDLCLSLYARAEDGAADLSTAIRLFEAD